MVDDEILSILRQRYEDCGWYYGDDKDKYCNDLYKTYQDASTAWFIKCMNLKFIKLFYSVSVNFNFNFNVVMKYRWRYWCTTKCN